MADEKSVRPREASKRANSIARGREATPPTAQSTPESVKKVNATERTVSHSQEAGDIPETLRKRYFSTTSKWSGEPAYFTTAQAKEPAFRDQGRRLITSSESEEVVRDIVAIADGRTSMSRAARRSEGLRGSKPVAKVWRSGGIGQPNAICRS